MIRKVSIVIGLVALFVVASAMSFEDEMQEQAYYCKMVSEGAWPDYNGNFDKICAD